VEGEAARDDWGIVWLKKAKTWGKESIMF